MKKLIFLILASILIAGCRTTKPIYVPIHDSSSVETNQTITNNPTWTDPESAIYQFAFECDSAYNVILKRYNELNTGLNSKVEIKEVIVYREDKREKNRLLVDISVLVDSLEVQNRTIERLRTEITKLEVPVPVEVPVKYTPKWKNYAVIGFFILIVLIVLYLYVRFKLKILK